MRDRSDEIRHRLEELRRSTTLRAARFDNTFEEIVEASSDVATDDEHDPEGHTIAWERQQVAALLSEANAALAQIDAAAQRLDAGTYGICIECDLPIPPERLEALPATPTCVACAGRSGRR